LKVQALGEGEIVALGSEWDGFDEKVRGVWGCALRHVDVEAYQRIFASDGAAHRRLPRYILRPAPPDPATAPAVEWIFVGCQRVPGTGLVTCLGYRQWYGAWSYARAVKSVNATINICHLPDSPDDRLFQDRLA